MIRSAAPLLLAVFLAGSLGCSSSNRLTPKPLEGASIEQRIQKNIASDGITGLHINVRNGIVTLSGDARSRAQRDQAIRDAQKVRGVSMVVDRINVGR